MSSVKIRHAFQAIDGCSCIAHVHKTWHHTVLHHNYKNKWGKFNIYKNFVKLKDVLNHIGLSTGRNYPTLGVSDIHDFFVQN